MIAYNTFTAEVLDGNKKSTIREPKDKIMEHVADYVTGLIHNDDRRPIILNAGTGTGKSSILLYHLYLKNPMYNVVCSEVTNANVKSLFSYVASLPGMQEGVNIGYQTGHGNVITEGPSIHYQTIKTTTMSILRPLIAQTEMMTTTILVIDESHTNDINMIEQLALVKYIYSSNSTIPIHARPFVIIQSASVDPFQMANYMETDLIISVQGQRFPISTVYLDDLAKDPSFDQNKTRFLPYCAAAAVKQIVTASSRTAIGRAIEQSRVNPKGSILIFAPSTMLITNIISILEEEQKNTPQLRNIPVYQFSRVAIDNDYSLIERVVTGNTMRIIVSTNVIETGFTIPDLSFVIDTLKFEQVYFNPVTKMDVLRHMPISVSMHQQRRGRVGRTQGGVYIPLTKQHIEKQIKVEQSCIRYTDLKNLILENGELFDKLQFMEPLPSELVIDVKQMFALTKWSSKALSIHLGMLSAEKLRFSVINRFLIIKTIQLGGRIADILSVIVFIESIDIRGVLKPAREGTVNDFLEILNFIHRLEIEDIPYTYMQQFANACQHFYKLNFDIYSGKSLIKHPEILQQAIEQAYRLNILTFEEQNDGKHYYRSLYGVRAVIKIPPGTKPPKYLTYNKMIDAFGKVRVDFVAQVKEPDFSDLCKFSVNNEERRRSNSR